MTTPTPSRQKIAAVAARLDEQEQYLAAASYEARDHTRDAQILTGLARCWSDTIRTLVHDGGLTTDVATGTLLKLAAAHSHPAARPAVVFLMPALVTAVERRDQLDSGMLDAHEVVDLPPAGCSWHEVARLHLDDDVAEALHPMLTGARLTATA